MVPRVDVARARELLEDERGRLEGVRGDIEHDGLIPETDEQTVAEDAGGQHPADVATDTEDRSRDLGLLERIESDLADVADALRRLDEGSYGRCEVCEEPIPDERLEAQPTARRCVRHQQELETAGRLPGEKRQQT
jgi:RNA polymerase-binding transcription factor DksA